MPELLLQGDISPGCQSEEMNHLDEENVPVLDDQPRQTFAWTGLRLGQADSLHLMGRTAHAFANVGETPAGLLSTGSSTRVIGRPPDQL